jgi:hypothetical protein
VRDLREQDQDRERMDEPGHDRPRHEAHQLGHAESGERDLEDTREDRGHHGVEYLLAGDACRRWACAATSKSPTRSTGVAGLLVAAVVFIGVVAVGGSQLLGRYPGALMAPTFTQTGMLPAAFSAWGSRPWPGRSA